MVRKPIPDRKPVSTNPNLPDILRVGPPQYDDKPDNKPQGVPQDEIPPQLSPGSVPLYQERSPARAERDEARRSAEVGRMSEEINGGWGNRPQNPPEFAHLAVASEKNSSPPTQQFSNLHAAETSTSADNSGYLSHPAQRTLQPQNTGSNPWGDSLPSTSILHAPPNPAPLQHVDTADSVNDAWAFEAISNSRPQTQPPPPNRAAPALPGNVPGQNDLPLSPQELPAFKQESPGWDEDEADHSHTPQYTPLSTKQQSVEGLAAPGPSVPDKGVSGAVTPQVDQGSSSTNPWDEVGGSGRGPVIPQTPLGSHRPPPIPAEGAREGGGREEVDQGLAQSPTGKQESGVVTDGGLHIVEQPINPPALPPRSSTTVEGRENEGIPPTMPPRPSLEEQPWAQEQTYAPPLGPPPSHAGINDQKYQIKKITWHDHSSSFNPRVSPILTQNANGPCPLLALVNAMILSTPSSSTNEVAQYLANKTEVSLDDLLQAIINEHLSEENCRKRADKGEEEYPDIGELHEFLKRLHTGMNVNPRFIPMEEARSPDSLRNSMSHVHPSKRSESSIPGGFEQTKELELYASFGIRLIHGWLPEPTDPAYIAFKDQAQTHEDVQLVLLRQDELEHKLENNIDGGLSEQDAELLQDIYLMHDFMRTNPTQLSPFGLEAIRTSLKKGEFAILFRNSHFMVVYKHPETEMLFCLVTDEGYREQGEVVWESLMDCDGSSMEIFSGNFEILSGTDHASRSGHAGSSATAINSSPHSAGQRPGLDTVVSDWAGEESEEERRRREREDADMAFAMSIQDEFNEESEAQEARRRREQELSERFIDSSRNDENTIPIERPEGRRFDLSGGGRGRGGGTWASRGGAGPIGSAQGALQRGRTSMLDPGPMSPIGGPRVSIPTRRTTSGQAPFTPISPVTNTARPVPSIPIPIPGQHDNSGIPTSLLQAPQPSVDPEAGVDNPPPSYEQAASQPKYEGPIERPAGGPAVAGGIIGEAAGVHEQSERGTVLGVSTHGPYGMNVDGSRRQSLRESLSAQRRRVSDMRRAQIQGQAGSPIVDPRTQGRERRDESDCVVM